MEIFYRLRILNFKILTVWRDFPVQIVKEKEAMGLIQRSSSSYSNTRVLHILHTFNTILYYHIFPLKKTIKQLFGKTLPGKYDNAEWSIFIHITHSLPWYLPDTVLHSFSPKQFATQLDIKILFKKKYLKHVLQCFPLAVT